jgi:hypothetical protein
MKTKFGVLATWLAGSLTAGLGAPLADASSKSDEEVQKQAARLIAQAISQRVGTNVALRDATDEKKKGGGMWASVGYMPLEFDSYGGGASPFTGNIDVVQGIYGTDFGGKGMFMGGVVVSLNTSVFTTSSSTLTSGGGFTTRTDFDLDSTGVSGGFGPYAALILSDNFFLAGQATYGWSVTDSSSTSSSETRNGVGNLVASSYNYTPSSSTSNSLNAEVSANAQVTFGGTSLRGKAAVNTSTSFPDTTNNPSAETTTSYNTVVGAELEQMFGRNVGMVASASTYLPFNQDTSAPGYVETPTTVNAGIGLFFKPGERFQIGLQYDTQFGDDALNVSVFGINFRMTN